MDYKNNKNFENELARRIEREFDNMYYRFRLGDELEPIMLRAVKTLETLRQADLLPNTIINKLYGQLKSDLINTVDADTEVQVELEIEEITERIWKI